jgi:hypothetical protein
LRARRAGRPQRARRAGAAGEDCALTSSTSAAGKLGTIDIGDTRTFTGVLSADVYDEARGYGFFPARGREQLQHWISNALERDSVRMNP